jgi:hypothetical protein
MAWPPLARNSASGVPLLMRRRSHKSTVPCPSDEAISGDVGEIAVAKAGAPRAECVSSDVIVCRSESGELSARAS